VGGRTLNHPIGDGKVVESAAVVGPWSGAESSPDQRARSRNVRHLRKRAKNLFSTANSLSSTRGDPEGHPLALVDVPLAMTRLGAWSATVPTERAVEGA